MGALGGGGVGGGILLQEFLARGNSVSVDYLDFYRRVGGIEQVNLEEVSQIAHSIETIVNGLLSTANSQNKLGLVLRNARLSRCEPDAHLFEHIPDIF